MIGGRESEDSRQCGCSLDYNLKIYLMILGHESEDLRQCLLAPVLKVKSIKMIKPKKNLKAITFQSSKHHSHCYTSIGRATCLGGLAKILYLWV